MLCAASVFLGGVGVCTTLAGDGAVTRTGTCAVSTLSSTTMIDFSGCFVLRDAEKYRAAATVRCTAQDKPNHMVFWNIGTYSASARSSYMCDRFTVEQFWLWQFGVEDIT